MPKRRMTHVVGALLVILATGASAAPPREGFVPVEGGLRVHYRVIGQGEDNVIIPSDVGWGTRADGLARGRTVVLYDPRGRGRSDEIKDPCDQANERPTGRTLSVMGRLFERLGDWDFTAQAGTVRARVLTVHGAKDNIPLESSREWVRTLPNARLLVLDASGHLPFAEQPAEFTAAVDTFLKGNWPERAEPGR